MDFKNSDAFLNRSRSVRRGAARCLFLVIAMMCKDGFAADVTFNISYIAEANPFPPEGTSNFSYADVWAENGYAYLGSDRGIDNSSLRRGVSVFSISNSGIPTFLGPLTSPPPGYAGTTYFGSEMEDIEVYDGVGYFASDVNGATGRTGVDIVDLSIPFDPVMLSRVDTSDCLSGSPTVCAHAKVHTVSIQRINPNSPTEQRFMYTSDNETSTIKITDVSNKISPVLVKSLSLPGVGANVDTHEVVVRNNRLYAASKDPASSATEAWTHIYDVSDPLNPILLKGFQTGAKTHTAMPLDDGKTLIVAQERNGGEVRIYDISMINSANDPDSPVLLKTLTANSSLSTANVCRFSNGDNDCADAGEQPIDAFSPHHVHVHGNLLFLAWYNAGLQVFNIANPANPVYVGAFDTWPGTSSNFDGNWGVDLSLGLDRVLLSDRKRGLIVVDARGVVAQGDYNTNTLVNQADYTEWRKAFDTTRSSVHNAPLADGNYNGVVDAGDYVLWRKRVGSGTGAGAVNGQPGVPEPASVFLLLLGGSLMFLHRRVHVE